MKWSLNELQKYRSEPLIISDTVVLKESLMKRENELLDVSPVHLEGVLTVNDGEVLLHMVVSLDVTLPSARSLEPVLVPMKIGIDEVYIPGSAISGEHDKESDDETVIPIENDLIDLSEAVEDAVLLNLPLQVFTEKEKQEQNMPKGNDWEVISEEDYFSELTKKQSEFEDPRFAGLKDLFKDEAKDSEK